MISNRYYADEKKKRLEEMADEIERLNEEALSNRDLMKTKGEKLTDDQYGVLEDELYSINKQIEELECSWQLLYDQRLDEFMREVAEDMCFDEVKQNRWGAIY